MTSLQLSKCTNHGAKLRLNKAACALDSFDLDKLLISTSAILKQNIAHAFSSYPLRLIQNFKTHFIDLHFPTYSNFPIINLIEYLIS